MDQPTASASSRHLRANGKLLLTGEYFVLDGALALALPTRLGQSLEVDEPADGNDPDRFRWESFDEQDQCWFAGDFQAHDGQYRSGTDTATGGRLEQIFRAIARMNPGWLQTLAGRRVRTRLEFPRNWGLGSSSTLIAMLARWSGCDPYTLLAQSFGGSGYDLACAQAQGPILFQRNEGLPGFVHFPFQPAFRNQLFFVYLGQKQNSREGISRYRDLTRQGKLPVDAISRLTAAFVQAATLTEFEALIREHESIVSSALQLPRAKDLYFPDFPGEIKSLGAWGGDFVLATSEGGEEETKDYFLKKGFPVVLGYEKMAL